MLNIKRKEVIIMPSVNSRLANRLGQFYTIDPDPIEQMRALMQGKMIKSYRSKTNEHLDDFLNRLGAQNLGDTIVIPT